MADTNEKGTGRDSAPHAVPNPANSQGTHAPELENAPHAVPNPANSQGTHAPELSHAPHTSGSDRR